VTVIRSILMASAVLCMGACSGEAPGASQMAPGAPGAPATWSNAEKTAIGTSYETYDAGGQFSDASLTAPISKLWFSLGKDRVTEIMWGLIHEAQIREIRFLLAGPDGLIEPSEARVHVDGEVLPVSPTPSLELTYPGIDQAVTITVFADPDRDALVVNAGLSGALPEGVRLYAYIDPAMANTGSGDRAQVVDGGLHAYEGEAHLFARLATGAAGEVSVGYVGASDGLADLSDGRLGAPFSAASEAGNVAGVIAFEFDEGSAIETASPATQGLALGSTLVIGFGESEETAKAAAGAAAVVPMAEIYTKYASQWQAYLEGLEHLPELASASGDGGALAYMSAINLKIMEDKTHAGALIASLSNPWGETAPADQPQTGYKAVWPRDFFQVASAFSAMGDEETARAAYRYLPTVQVTDETPGNSGVTGWFLQKTHVDGEIEWVAIQQDQTAMPIMLGWKLWQDGVLSDEEIAESYQAMLKPAADFLVKGGRPNILWNTEFEASLGYTQQERWEEQEGYSPSTVAAVISGLVTAADLAERFGDPADAAIYLEAVDRLEDDLETWMFTTNGDLGSGEYFVRITQNTDPNDKAQLGDNNGRPGLPEDQIVDGGFLELVRYGVRAWDAPSIQSTLAVLDASHPDNLRVRYEFENGHVGWRRYGNDGYGEDGVAGTNYHEIDGGNTPGQRGRVWPFFSGERAHYEIAKLESLLEVFGAQHPDVAQAKSEVKRLISSMEAFANGGLSLPEQVWDGVEPNPFGYELGEGTNSATPLAWSHAEYIKLLRSYVDQAVWDRYPVVEERFENSDANRAQD